MDIDIEREQKISEERQALRTQLQSRSVMLFVTLASIGDAVITTDTDGNITFLNPMAEALTGWGLADAIGVSVENVFQLVEEKTGKAAPNPVRAALENLHKVTLISDVLLVRKDGARIPIDDSGAPILGGDDELLGAILVFRDVTERKKAEQMLRFRSELDRMAARISTAFITSPVNEVDARIHEALINIGLFFDADRVSVFLYDWASYTMTCAYEWKLEGLEPQKGMTSSASLTPHWTERISNRRYIAASSIDDLPKYAREEQALWKQRQLQSLVIVPMSQEDRVIGHIGIESLREPKPWPEEIINVLYLLGNVFAGAIGRRDAQQKLEAARAREVEIGSRIQQTLLLSTPPIASADFQLASLTIPSRGIDGDFYDFLLHPNRSLDVIFGDVMGKGVPAALLSAGAKTEFLRSLSHLLVSSARGSIPQPADIVNGVHSVLTPQLMNLESFVTLTYVRFDPQVKKVILVDCGNTRLMRCHWEDGEIEHLSGLNLPLGFESFEIYSEVEFDYTQRDVFVLYSDGTTEARNAEGELFGRDRLQAIVARNRKMPPEGIIDAVQDSVREFVGSTSLNDDLTCVVIRVMPEEPKSFPLTADELIIPSSLDNLGAVRSFLRGFCDSWKNCGLTEHELNLVELAVNEVASNIMRHAYKGRVDETISIRILREEAALRVRLTHAGTPFVSPDRIPVPPMDSPREGGFGLFIISRAVDRVDYGQEADGRQYIELMKMCSDI